MGRAKQFARSSFWLTISMASVLLVGAVYRPIIGRILGPTEYGQYSFIQVFINYFLIIAFFGTRSVIVREIGRNPSTARWYTILALKLRVITALAAILLCCLIGYALHRSHQVTVGIYVLSISIGFLAVGDLIEGTLIAVQKSFWIAAANVVGGIFKLSVGIWALKSGYGLIGVIWVFVAASAITTIISWLSARDVIRAKPDDTEAAGYGYILKESVPFVILFLTNKVYSKNDLLILTFVKGDLVTGLYNAAYIFVDLLMSVGNCFTQAAFPMLSRIYKSDDDGESGVELVDAYERLHKHLLMIFLPLSVILMLFSSEALLLVFGKDFRGGATAMLVLSWMPVTEVSCLVSGNFLCATYRQSLEAKIASIITSFSVIWTFVFIYWFGALGAAAATLSISLINAVTRYVFIRRTIGPASIIKAWLKPFMCAGVMLAASCFTSHMFWVWELSILCIAYVLTIPLFKPYDKKDRKMLQSVLHG